MKKKATKVKSPRTGTTYTTSSFNHDMTKPDKKADPAADILTILRQLEPEQQNEVLRTVLSELAIDFDNRRASSRSESNRQQDCFETFINLRDQPERTLKAALDKAENGKPVRQ